MEYQNSFFDIDRPLKTKFDRKTTIASIGNGHYLCLPTLKRTSNVTNFSVIPILFELSWENWTLERSLISSFWVNLPYNWFEKDF